VNKLITIPSIVGFILLGVIDIINVPTEAGDNTEPDEESKFMHKLEYLRTQAEVFLKMLNDMRRRLKELSPESPAAQQYRYACFVSFYSLPYSTTLLTNIVLLTVMIKILYRNVMRDVTRLLYLLNKKTSNVQMPADGMTLLDWSEKILNRYLKSQVQCRLNSLIC
jgi:hypothetical protein